MLTAWSRWFPSNQISLRGCQLIRKPHGQGLEPHGLPLLRRHAEAWYRGSPYHRSSFRAGGHESPHAFAGLISPHPNPDTFPLTLTRGGVYRYVTSGPGERESSRMARWAMGRRFGNDQVRFAELPESMMRFPSRNSSALYPPGVAHGVDDGEPDPEICCK